MSASSFAAVSPASRWPLLVLIALAVALPASAHVPRSSQLDAIDATRELTAAPPIDDGSIDVEPIKLYDAPTSFSVFTSENRTSRPCCVQRGGNAQQHLMHARYYNPHQGRFLSVDPVLDVKRALREPQAWNRYSYVVNNPINRIDPDGRVDQNWDGGAAAQLFPDDGAAQREFDQDVAEKTAIGAATFIGGIGGWAARGVLATAVLNPRLALAAGSILASMAEQPTLSGIRSIVVPDGRKIGVEGTSAAIRFVKGGFSDAKAMFQSLAKGGTITKLGKDILSVDLKGVGQVTLRTVSGTEGVRATVQLNVKGVGVREIKYVDELPK